MKKKLALFALLVFCFMANAATGQAKVSKKIKNLTNEFTTYSAYTISTMEQKNEKVSLNFASADSRIQVLSYNKKVQKGTGADKVSKMLFGTKTYGVTPVQGDWGEDHPYITVKKVKKLGGKKYLVTANVMNKLYGSSSKEKWGTVKLYVTKKKKTKYGYLAYKLIVQRTKSLV